MTQELPVQQAPFPESRAHSRRPWTPIAACLGALLALIATAGHAAGVSEATQRADGWAVQPITRERDQILEGWAVGASLPDLMWVLRHDSAALGPVERILVERALARVPGGKPAVRARLEARRALIDARARKAKKPGPTVVNPYASAFRVALLVPGGDYGDFGAALRDGLRHGLTPETGAAGGFPVDVDLWQTPPHDPARLLAMMDSSLVVDGAVVGELLSTPTLLMAAALRRSGVGMISPTATDETIGAIGPNVLVVGPSGRVRGARLAAALPNAPQRVAVLISSEGSRPFAEGFTDAVRAAGAQIVMQHTYSAGNLSFRNEVKELQTANADLLFWDGEPREIETLLRQIAKERISLAIVGGPALAPEQHHGETAFLLEGVRYIDDEWKPADAARGALDAASRARRSEPANSVFVRGWLAGRAIRRAIDSGALVPEELAAALTAQRDTEPWLGAHGFMKPSDVELRVYTVSRGKGVAVQE